MERGSWSKAGCIGLLSLVLKLSLVMYTVVFFLSVQQAASVVKSNVVLVDNMFPKDFLFGSASSAYQIEGGWDRDGKMPSIWDELVHNHSDLVVNQDTGDVAANSYDFYMEDVKLLKNAGFNFYRFSVAWSRILPTGDITSLNEAGIAYYNRLIDALLAENIQPMITMYHWDLPQELQTNYGGYSNPLIIEHFKVYADVLFKRFGDRVKSWITFNEPFNFCARGYGDGLGAPLVKNYGVGEYLCTHHMLLSHAAVYELYGRKYRAQQRGKIGITLNCENYYVELPDGSPSNSDPIVQRGLQYRLGWFAHPIFSKTGGYPQVMVDEIGNKSIAEGRLWSRLPTMTPEQKKQIQGSADFLGFNYYTSSIVTEVPPPASGPIKWQTDLGLKFGINASWPKGNVWLYSVPQGFGDLLRWIKREYDNPEVWITENGWPDEGTLDDVGRIQYVHDHLIELHKAIGQDGCNVKGYTAWSLIDNFEWRSGYTEKFGIYHVDFNSENRTRTAKKSVGYFKELIDSQTIPDSRKWV